MTLILLVSVFVASLFGTITGFGLATILVPILGLFFAFPQVLLLVGIIHFFGDLWRIFLFRKGLNLRLIILFGVPGLAASYQAARFVISISPLILQKALGVFLVTTAVWTFLKPRWQLPKSETILVGGGLAAGILSGILGVGGAVRAAFLHSFKLSQSVFLATAGVIGIMVDSARIAGYYQASIPLPVSITILVTAIVISLAGALLAKRVVTHISPSMFRQIVSLFLLVVGIRYLLFQ